MKTKILFVILNYVLSKELIVAFQTFYSNVNIIKLENDFKIICPFVYWAIQF